MIEFMIASEFTHEDYVGLGYDYISIRKAVIDYYYFLLHYLASEELLCEFLSKKVMNAIRHRLSKRATSAYNDIETI